MKKSMIYALVAAPMLSLAPAAHAQSLSEPAAMVMTKTPGCGCCDAWADLARAEGHTVEVIETYDYAGMKADHGVPNDLASCHSVKVGDYVERVGAPGGFDGILRGATFAGRGKTVVIEVTGAPIGSGESPPNPATLTYQRADGASRVFNGLWTCGP